MPENTRPDRDIPYLALDEDVEARIRADRAAHVACPWRFPDERVVRREDNPHDEATLTRPAFARDIEKILNVPRVQPLRGQDAGLPRSSRTTTCAAAACTCSSSRAWRAGSARF